MTIDVMTDHEQQLLRILRIGHETSMRGSGVSLQNALNEASYQRLRQGFQSQDLLSLIRANPALIQEWLRYSEDKRTGGWYLLDDGSIGFASDKSSHMQFPSLEEAVANYVVRELDYWAG